MLSILSLSPSLLFYSLKPDPNILSPSNPLYEFIPSPVSASKLSPSLNPSLELEEEEIIPSLVSQTDVLRAWSMKLC